MNTQESTLPSGSSSPKFGNTGFKPGERGDGRWESLASGARPIGATIDRDYLDGKYLRVDYGKPRHRGGSNQLADDADFEMLRSFADLCENDEGIGAFAASNGALCLCKDHGLPVTHTNPSCLARGGQAADGGMATIWERIDHWKHWSSIARAIITALRGTGDERESALPELKKFLGDNASENHKDWPYEAAVTWLAGGVVHIDLDDHRKGLVLRGMPPLWVAIGIQLVTLAARATGIILCSNCGRLEAVNRAHRNVNRRSYCSKCRKGKKKSRHSMADLRAREKQTLELYREGKKDADIAGIVGVTEKKVRHYIQKALAKQKKKEAVLRQRKVHRDRRAAN